MAENKEESKKGEGHAGFGRAFLQSCPVLQDAPKVVALGRETTLAIRKLKRDLKVCKNCPLGDNCPVLQKFHAEVEAAISDLADEWNLVP